MEKLLEKISSYNILNNLLPGGIFCYAIKYLNNINIIQNNILDNIFIYYFIGMIISRIGSIIIEPICKKVKLVRYADYKSYLVARKIDDNINILLESNNTYRTFLAASISFMLVQLYIWTGDKISLLYEITPYVLVALVTTIFIISYKKQTQYIKDRIEHIVEKSK